LVEFYSCAHSRAVVHLWRPAIYAVVETGGKQYRVSLGQTIDVERLSIEGDTVELDKVLLIADGEEIALGRPIIAGARVVADIVGDGKGDKVIVFKYKPKVRYRVKKGHRQPYTRLIIRDIIPGPKEGE